MRACFLGQNICALGNGIAIVQTTPIKGWPPKKKERRAAANKALKPVNSQEPIAGSGTLKVRRLAIRQQRRPCGNAQDKPLHD